MTPQTLSPVPASTRDVRAGATKVDRTAPRQTKDALGRRLCRMPTCGNPVAKGRRSYCSAACADAFAIAYFPAQARHAVHRRDKGVCAICGCDTDKLRRVLRHFQDNLRTTRRIYNTSFEVRAVTGEIGFGRGLDDGDFWQADHIVECVRGGWGTGLDNLRTLCTPCHKAETKRLAAELAAERRDAKAVSGLSSLFPSTPEPPRDVAAGATK